MFMMLPTPMIRLIALINNNMKIISNEITNKVVYGQINIATRVGILEYSYQSGTGFDDNYQLESTFSKIHELTDEELDQIDDLIIDNIIK